jgi:pimeloyl-ACP methyl ester carboxylesterase
VLLCHGQPTWSYLYRKIISPLVAAGYRCVAPDLIGFGKSDKHVLKSAYTYETHVKWLSALVLGLEKLRVLRPPSRPSPTSIIASAASQHRYWSNTGLPVVGDNGRSAPMPRIQAQEQLPSLVLPWHDATNAAGHFHLDACHTLSEEEDLGGLRAGAAGDRGGGGGGAAAAAQPPLRGIFTSSRAAGSCL